MSASIIAYLYISFNDNGVTLFDANLKSSSISILPSVAIFDDTDVVSFVFSSSEEGESAAEFTESVFVLLLLLLLLFNLCFSLFVIDDTNDRCSTSVDGNSNNGDDIDAMHLFLLERGIFLDVVTAAAENDVVNCMVFVNVIGVMVNVMFS